MSEQFKPGDLVMLVKPTPCCGSAASLGSIYTVSPGIVAMFRCLPCGTIAFGQDLVELDGEYCAERNRLKKIDPPATGDSLPTRAELEQIA